MPNIKFTNCPDLLYADACVFYTLACLTVLDFGVGDGNNLDQKTIGESQMHTQNERLCGTNQAHFKFIQLSV